ncbi:hypothetical protein [Paenibacillus senegalensis]|uniref:hypothetical protein n=1 Tax=Paenibacillus senegalensis TaxID=1465766 RepID=UPI001F1F3306|nr:hypothetical protein [Paenibacillus senegalensis]
MKADQETACDASVLERLGEREASSYGMTLLMLSRLFSRRFFFSVTIPQPLFPVSIPHNRFSVAYSNISHFSHKGFTSLSLHS